MDNTTFTETEEKSLVGLLYNHISLGTTLEVFGETTKEGIARLDGFRSIFSKLLQKYNLKDAFTEENYLLLGIIDRVSDESLEAWSVNDKNKHLQLRARYFQTKKVL